jgi:hypothetical protein
MMRPADCVALAFGPVDGVEFVVGVYEDVVVFGKVWGNRQGCYTSVLEFPFASA